MKKSVTVSVESEKLSALEMYLGQKNLNKTQFWVHLSISKNHPDNPENIHIRNFPIFLFV